MKPVVLTLMLLLVVVGRPGDSAPRAPRGILDGVHIPPLNFVTPKIEVRGLPGKAELLLVTNRDLPMVQVAFEFARGLDAEPISRAGSLQAMTRLLEIGGAGARDGKEFQEALAQIGARLSVKTAHENWTVSVTSLRDDLPRALDLLRELLLNPRLPAEKLAVVQNELMASIRARNDQAASIAGRKMNEILYPGRRRGYSLQSSDIRRLSAAEAREEWERRMTADQLRVLCSGDLDPQLVGQLERLIDALPRKAAPPAAAEVKDEDPFRSNPLYGKIVLVRKDAVQAVLAAGVLLPPHRHPDFFALQLCNQVLGGGSFNSRLMREIRVKRGLAYYAYSYNSFEGAGGRFGAGSATRVESVAQTLRLMLSTIESMQSGVDKQELHLAKESILNGLVFQFEDPAAYLASEARFRRHGLPPDYLKTFPGKMRQVGDADVRRVARRLQPKNLLLVVVGPERMRASLSSIRPVVVIDPEELPPR